MGPEYFDKSRTTTDMRSWMKTVCGLQISQLSVSMRQARMRSTVELLGRKQLAPGEDLPLTPADPASRILEALLSVPDQAERLHMLTEALQAPDPATPTAEVRLEYCFKDSPEPCSSWMFLAFSKIKWLHPEKEAARLSVHRDGACNCSPSET